LPQAASATAAAIASGATLSIMLFMDLFSSGSGGMVVDRGIVAAAFDRPGRAIGKGYADETARLYA
jgi:hypothetical protein